MFGIGSRSPWTLIIGVGCVALGLCSLHLFNHSTSQQNKALPKIPQQIWSLVLYLLTEVFFLTITSIQIQKHVSAITVASCLWCFLYFPMTSLNSCVCRQSSKIVKKTCRKNHCCNKLKPYRCNAYYIKHVILMTLVGAHSASLLHHMSALPGNVSGMQTASFHCWWGLYCLTGVRVQIQVHPSATWLKTSLIC